MPAPPCGNYGDVDGDGNVNIDDVTKVAAYLHDHVANPLTADQKNRADVDGDGTVTNADQSLIYQYAVGQITTFPVCSLCPWDLNGDGVVDDADRAIFDIAYGSKAGDTNWNPACDFNNSGEVDLDDLVLLGANYGACPNGAEHMVSFKVPIGSMLKVGGVEII